ncbi:MAG: hypothetical protein ACE5DL_01675 [Nitrosopumilaceae archaeon]
MVTCKSNTQNYEIIFTKSTDDGETFSTPQNISTNVGTSEAPSMVMIDKEIFVVWHDTSIDGYGILFSKSKIVDMQNFKN